MRIEPYCPCGRRVTVENLDATKAKGLDDYIRCTECLSMIKNQITKKAYKPQTAVSKARGVVETTKSEREPRRSHKERPKDWKCPRCKIKCYPFYYCPEHLDYHRKRYAAKRRKETSNA